MGKDRKFDIYDYFNFARFITFGREKMKKYFKEHQIEAINKEQFIECTPAFSKSSSTQSAPTTISSSGNPSSSNHEPSLPKRSSTWNQFSEWLTVCSTISRHTDSNS